VNSDEQERVAKVRSLAEKNFLGVRGIGGAAFQITAGARGRVVCAGDLAAVEHWLIRYNERIDAEVRRATRSQADLELEEMTNAVADPGQPVVPVDPRLAADHAADVETSVVVQCAVITSQLGELSELLFRNPGALGDRDGLRITEFTAVLRQAADTLDGLLPGR
jgi:hypothetical protein